MTHGQGMWPEELLSVKCFLWHREASTIFQYMNFKSNTEKSQMENTCLSHSENTTLPLDSTYALYQERMQALEEQQNFNQNT